MKKNVVYWVGIKNPDLAEKYGNFDYFEYSRATWEYWCKQNDCIFVEFDSPVEPDMLRFRVNWQKAMFVFDELERDKIDYDQIFLVDSSCMIKWDAPNIFELTEHKFCGWPDTDNMRWIHDSIQGYKSFFDNFELDQDKYVSSGVIIFNEQHKKFFESFKNLYYDNVDTFINLQDNIVKKGTEQTPFNYWLQMQGVDVKLDLPKGFKLTHMHRTELFSHNWQEGDDKTPFFIKYGYNWVFNGIPKDQRSKMMLDTWNIVKHNYSLSDNESILNEMEHKDTAKYTTSRKFKRDILEIFRNDKFKDKTVVEIGASQGQSTRMLSYIFKKVVAVEWDDWNLEQARNRNVGRDNVEFVKMDLYNTQWKGNLPSDAAVVFIDAGHQYHQVKMDIENSLECFDDPILIFDDYGLIDPGSNRNEVKQAIDEKINEGKLTLYKFIGETPEDLVHASGVKINAMEGLICNFK